MSNVVVKRTADEIALEINIIKEQTAKMILNSSIEIGRKLVEAKELVNHGEWGNWLEEKVNYSQRTANNLMKIFNEYSTKQVNFFGEANSQSIANLSYTQAVCLLGIKDPDEREKFVEENEVSEMTIKELKAKIKEKEEQEHKLKIDKENIQNQLVQVQKENATLESECSNKEKSLSLTKETLKITEETLNNKLYEAENEADLLRKQLDELLEENKANKANIVDYEHTERIKEEFERVAQELEAKNEEIIRLHKELEDKPIEVKEITKEVVKEVVPEEIVTELKELKNNKDKIVFAAYLDSVTGAFNNLLAMVNNLPEESRGKYKGAVTKLLDKMKGSI